MVIYYLLTGLFFAGFIDLQFSDLVYCVLIMGLEAHTFMKFWGARNRLEQHERVPQAFLGILNRL